MKIIDPHLHLFDLSRGNYQWLKLDCPPFWSDKSRIAKSFSEQNLALTPPLTLSGFVHIEAGFDNEQPWREIAWLETTCNMPFRSVALLDIRLPKIIFSQQLEKIMHYKSVVGIRYILDDDAIAILSNKNSQDNLAILAVNKLSFELQMPLVDTLAVDSLIRVILAIPDLIFCINHAGWPTLDVINHVHWLNNLKRLAAFDNIFIKCSGYEMTDRNYSTDWQYTIISQCISNFGIARVMLASNFPLSLWHSSYQNTWLNNCALKPCNNEHLSIDDINQLCYQNAFEFYKFN